MLVCGMNAALSRPFRDGSFLSRFRLGRVPRASGDNTKKEPSMTDRNTDPGIGKTAGSGVMHTPMLRARVRVRVVCHTGILIISH